jgi:hypothetical protein
LAVVADEPDMRIIGVVGHLKASFIAEGAWELLAVD